MRASRMISFLLAGNYKLLLLLAPYILYCCSIEVDTKISLAQTTNPPSFKLTGTGSSPMLILSGPYLDTNDLSTKKQLWELKAFGPTAEKPLWQLPEIVYGTVPEGFVQKSPENSPPMKLEENKIYCLLVHVYGAKAGHMCFTVKEGRAVEIKPN